MVLSLLKRIYAHHFRRTQSNREQRYSFRRFCRKQRGFYVLKHEPRGLIGSLFNCPNHHAYCYGRDVARDELSTKNILGQRWLHFCRHLDCRHDIELDLNREITRSIKCLFEKFKRTDRSGRKINRCFWTHCPFSIQHSTNSSVRSQSAIFSTNGNSDR